MRPVRVSQTGTGSTALVVPDYLNAPFAIGLGITVTGTVSCKVEHTFDDPYAPGFNPATATYHDHPTLAGISAKADGNYAFPVRAIRLTVASGAGTATLDIIQAGVAT